MCRSSNLAVAVVLASAALILAPGPGTAHAQVVYDNGTFATTNGQSMTSSIQADDFTFSATQSFDAIRFWMVEQGAGLTTNFSGTLTWSVYTNNIDRPGAILFTGTTSAVTATDTGIVALNAPSLQIVRMDFGVPQVTLDAGTYWLALKENGPLVPNDGTPVFWVDSVSQTALDSRADTNETAPTTWGGVFPEDRAFQLIAVPEASTLALALPALGMVASASVGAIALRRRKRA